MGGGEEEAIKDYTKIWWRHDFPEHELGSGGGEEGRGFFIARRPNELVRVYAFEFIY